MVHRASPPGPILDVGSGGGVMLDAFHRLGRVAVGLERYADRPDVLTCDISECEYGWAAIVLWHSLEHLPAPRRALREAALRLVPGGVVIVAVPNAESIQARMFGDRWLHLDLPRHLTHLGSTHVEAALVEDGLTVTMVSHLRGGQVAFGWLHGLVGLLPRHPDLYQAIRRPSARERNGRRLPALLAAVGLGPVALVAAGLEVWTRHGGTVCVMGRRTS
ncbi:MAG: class I SAM-dependent methyltransferase [Candidatus Dormibacteraeota bacterium]|nr:class I SAM-dependent methyltransferase [Candidatus Dormibacteraeota bacterium]